MQRRPAELAIALTLGVALGAPGIVAARTGGVRITWTAPTECPTTADVSASVGHLLGQPPALPEGRELEVKARAERKQARLWIGSVETRYGATVGNRAFEAESCRAAADATALIVALMIEAAPTIEAAPPPASPPAEAARSSLTVSVGPTTALDVGTLPAPTAGAGVRAGLTFGRTSFDLAAVAWAPISTTIAGTDPPVGGTFRFFSASLAVCPTLAAGRFALGACGAAELVQVRGRGSGVSVPYENAYAWMSVGAGALARLRVSRHLSIPLRLSAMVPLAHPSFVLKGVVEAQGQVYSPSPILGRAELGIDVVF
jgi:hypothetical protein